MSAAFSKNSVNRYLMAALLVAGCVLAVAAYIFLQQAQAEPVAMKKEELLIVTAAGLTERFTVEIAETPKQRRDGLMFREQMAVDEGMLFVFEKPAVLTMWMENTILPLDMIFIGEGGRIVKIHHDAVPYSRETISSDVATVAVLEVNGGTAQRLGIQEGDAVAIQRGDKAGWRSDW